MIISCSRTLKDKINRTPAKVEFMSLLNCSPTQAGSKKLDLLRPEKTKPKGNEMQEGVREPRRIAMVNVSNDGPTEEERCERLVEDHYQTAMACARSWGFSHEDILDVAQETFIRLFAKISTFDGNNPKAWVWTTCKFVCMELYREKKKREKREVSIEELEVQIGTVDETPSENAEKNDILKIVQEILDKECKSKEWVKEALDLKMKGYTYRQIGERFGLEVGTVGAALSRIITNIREELKKRNIDWL